MQVIHKSEKLKLCIEWEKGGVGKHKHIHQLQPFFFNL